MGDVVRYNREMGTRNGDKGFVRFVFDNRWYDLRGGMQFSVHYEDGSLVYGTDAVGQAIPDPGKFFVKWTGYRSPITNTNIKWDIESYDDTFTIPATQKEWVVVYAEFVDGVTLTLAYDANGGSDAPASESQTVAQGTSAAFVVAAAPEPPRGYRFVGWSIGGETYLPGDEASISESATAEAEYEPVPAHTVSFSVDPADDAFTPAIIVTEPTRTEGGTDCYDDTIDVVIRPVARNGYLLKSVVFFDVENPSVAISTFNVTGGSLDPFVLSSSDRGGRNMLLRFRYDQIDYSVTANVHDASASKVSVSASSATAHWGDTVTFLATDIAEGYAFAGWYDADGALQFSDASYEVTVQGDVALYAKCKVECSMSIDYPSGTADADKTCSLTKDGESYVFGTGFDMVLGDSFAYALALGARTPSENWSLDRWTDGEGAAPLMYGQSGSVSPTAPLALVAHVASMSATSKTLTVKTGAMGQSLEPAVPYERTGEEGIYQYQPVNPYTFEGNIPPAMASSPSLLGATPPTGEFVNTFAGGVQYVRLTALPQIWFQSPSDSSVYVEQSFRGFYESADLSVPLSREASCYLLMASDRTVWAAYGEATPVSLNLEYADSDSANRGSISIVSISDIGTGESIAADGRSAQVLQGHSATLRAVPKNGYEFAGWYNSAFTAGDALSTNATFQYTVMARTSIYAKFSPARDRICAWEGSSENKTMEWTSKVYVMPKPFDPVAARVDAAGYPVDLTVRTYSSPDKANPLPVRDHALTSQNPLAVRSQDGRRLPRMRPERYVQFTVRAANEVDAVAIGTNMAEVN